MTRLSTCELMPVRLVLLQGLLAFVAGQICFDELKSCQYTWSSGRDDHALKHLFRWANIPIVAIALKCFYMYSKNILLFPQDLDLDDAEEDDSDVEEGHDEL